MQLDHGDRHTRSLHARRKDYQRRAHDHATCRVVAPDEHDKSAINCALACVYGDSSSHMLVNAGERGVAWGAVNACQWQTVHRG
jgi:hypothetical protein